MAQIKCGMLLLASVLLFWVLSKWRFLPSKPSAVITPPFASSSHPSICPCSKTWESMTITDFSLCSSERHCCRNVTPSFHAPLARMCAHRRGRGWIICGHSNTQSMRSIVLGEPCIDTTNTVPSPALMLSRWRSVVRRLISVKAGESLKSKHGS